LEKAHNVQNAGGVAMVLANDREADVFGMSGVLPVRLGGATDYFALFADQLFLLKESNMVDHRIMIPVMMVSRPNGEDLESVRA